MADPGIALQLGPLTIRWYGVVISGAMLLCIILASLEVKRQYLDVDDLYTLALVVIPCAVLGARLYHVFFSWDFYSRYPQYILAIWRGGLAWHGGLIGGISAAVLCCYYNKMRFYQWADIVVPLLALGQSIGRWGNYFNREAYGPVIEPGSFWSWVPFQVWAEGAYHHPTFLYEAIWNICVFTILMRMLHRPHHLGEVFGSYFVLYSSVRFFLELLRNDSLMIGPFRSAMLISIVSICFGLYMRKLAKKRPVVDFDSPDMLDRKKRRIKG
ncbi:MAG: prolipoprotein diacylglyceryl transferase [Firmicutes bacterium]|nr:prolipoprotein diacylglyceryl transferase [Bacillota bacterium]MBR7113210.1 prolipoprotein diacylglyceryl transferase [Bacillota bacterium]